MIISTIASRAGAIHFGPSLGLALGLLLPPATPMAEALQSEQASCACVQLFDALTVKVEENYPGYHLEVRRAARAEAYARAKSAMRIEAATTETGIECVALLQQYVTWFEDGHLFVGGRQRVATAEDTARLRAAAPRVSWTETGVHHYLETRADNLDPLEGIWIDAAGIKLAVVRNDMAAVAPRDTAKAASFIAFVIASSSHAWKPGDVRAELNALPDGSYEIVMYDEVRARMHPRGFTRGLEGGGRLQREGLLLHAPPTTWGKLHPVRPGHEGLIDGIDPRAPTARMVGDKTVVFHVPSHVPAHAPRLRALVDQYRGALGRARDLIIDLRGNEGGSTFVTDVLMPFLTTPDKRPARYLVGGASAVISADDNIAYFERMSWSPAGLVARLRAAERGTLVAFADEQEDGSGSAETEVPNDARTLHPVNVAILTDAMTVSAAEAFVLKAMRNKKVTLFGQATGGSIDYQNVNIVPFGCRQAGLFVGYPTIVGSDRLPEGGVRPTGIVPDIALDPRDDPISRIIEYYDGVRP